MSSIECGLLRASDTDDAAHLLAVAFSTADPPAIAVGLTEAEIEQFATPLCAKAVTDGLTVVARSLPSNQFAGVLLTDDFAMPPTFSTTSFSHKFLPILTMLDGLDEEYRKSHSVPAGQYLHLFMLAVDGHFSGRGIAQQLVTACLSNGNAKGYTHAITEATGVVSQHVFRKLGFTDRLRASYRDYRYQGRAVFASIGNHEAAILMDRATT
jgi:ribosomal protein S18 acetylase RimI-like enzyme